MTGVHFVFSALIDWQAMEYARRMRDDRGKGNIVVVEDGEENAASMGDDEFAVSDVILHLRHSSKRSLLAICLKLKNRPLLNLKLYFRSYQIKIYWLL